MIDHFHTVQEKANNNRTNLFALHFVFVMVCAGILTIQQAYCDGDPADSSAQSKTTNSLLEQGDRLHKDGHFQRAQQIFVLAVEQARTSNDRISEGWALKHLSAVLLNLDDYDQAFEKARESLAIAREIDDRALIRNALNVLGLSYYWQKDYSKAISAYKQAIAIAVESPNENWKVLNNLGEAYYWQMDYQNAIAAYKKALAYAEQDGSRTSRSITLKNIGDALFWKNDYAPSIEHFYRALRLTDDEVQKGYIHVALGNAYSSNGQYEHAIDQFEEAIEIFSKTDNTYILTNTFNGVAIAYNAIGNSEEAIRNAKNAIELAEKNSHTALGSTAWSNLAQAEQNRNRIERATEAYARALELASNVNAAKEKITAVMGLSLVHKIQGNYIAAHDALEQLSGLTDSDFSLYSVSLINLGQLYIELGDYNKAIYYFKKNLEVAEAGYDQAAKIDAHQNLGNAYYTGGFFANAKGQYHQALALAKRDNLSAQQVVAMANLSWAYRSMANNDTAKVYAEQSVRLSNKIDDPWIKVQSLHALNQIQMITQDPRSIDTAKALMKLSKETGAVPLSNAMSILGGAYEQSGEYSKAIDLYQQVLTKVRHSQDQAQEGSTLVSLGTAYQRAGELSAAETAFRQAIAIWESFRTRLGDRDSFKVSLLEKQRSAYQNLQKILISQGKINEALEISEKGRARALADLLKRRFTTLSDQLTDIEVPKLAEMVAVAKGQGITIVEYSTTLEAIFIWVIKPNGNIAFEKVDIFLPSAGLTVAALASRSKLYSTTIGDTISKTRAVIAVDDPPQTSAADRAKQIDEGLRTLYDLLIEPISSHLPRRMEDRIIFVPQGDLFQVSFPALKDKEGKYLIEKHTIQTATSIQLLKLTHNLRKLQRKSAETRSLYEPLVVGNPAMPYIHSPSGTSGVSLANLPGAEQEALAIADLLDVPALTGKAATESAITHRLKTASLAHFATHGLLDYGNPEVSGIRDIPGAIVLAPDDGMGTPEGDGLLTASEIMNLSLPAELVVLSACNTGRGDITADGVVGLSRALIAAGVPSIIVSLWAVPDAPTSQLMTAFYRNIERTGDKAQALRQAMLSTLKTYPNPADWAAFTLIGEAF